MSALINILTRNITSGYVTQRVPQFQRNICVTATRLTRSSSGDEHHHHHHHHNHPHHHKQHDHDHALRAEVLLSSDNRQRLLECMQKAPPMGIALRSSKQESAFAAVLICLCTDDQGEVSLLYTRRSGQLSRHVRQISFPGGIKDPGDADFIDCALRETEEEIGLPRSRVEIWGTGKLITPPHTAAIMPVVGVVENFDLNELDINEDEVEEAFVIPVRRLVHADAVRHTQFKTGYSAPAFVVGQYRVWGVTGYITSSFLNCLIPVEIKRLKHHVKYIRPYRHKHN